MLRVVVFERQLTKFYFFLIPREAYAHISKSSNIDIPFNLDGTPHRNSKVHNINWWEFEVPDFDGILADVAPSFINYREIRLDKKKILHTQKLEKLTRQQETLKALILKNQLKTSTTSSLNQCLPA